jgi:2-dehydropantoate 2-reductase
VKLALAGEQVTFMVRGANLAAIQSRGMKLVMHDGSELIATNVVATADYLGVGPQDLVILAMKAHQGMARSPPASQRSASLAA